MGIIKVDGLTMFYGPVQALNAISFEVEKGEIIGLLGPNGAGKTTAMKILTGYLQPTEGTAMVAGYDVVKEPLRAQALLGYLPENAPLYQDMAVQEYLTMIADLRDIPLSRRKAVLSEAIYSTGLEKHLTSPIESLSKGYRQRVCLAQAILHKPQVLVLDEPTNGLDPTQIIEMRGLIKRLSEAATVIISTHILSEVEATADRAIIIMEGIIRADAKLSELTSSTNAVVAVERGAEGVIEAFNTVDGVTSVEKAQPQNGFDRFHVTADQQIELCPLIFDVVRDKGWRLAELRQETRTLESVFRELSQASGGARA